MSESNPRNELLRRFPEDYPKWEALKAAVEAAADLIWPEADDTVETRPDILLSAMFGDLPAPLLHSTMTPCRTLTFIEAMEEVADVAHDLMHGVNPETGMSPMSEKISYADALDRDLVSSAIRNQIDALIAAGKTTAEDVFLIAHPTTDDLDDLPETDEVVYTINNDEESS